MVGTAFWCVDLLGIIWAQPDVGCVCVCVRAHACVCVWTLSLKLWHDPHLELWRPSFCRWTKPQHYYCVPFTEMVGFEPTAAELNHMFTFPPHMEMVTLWLWNRLLDENLDKPLRIVIIFFFSQKKFTGEGEEIPVPWIWNNEFPWML